MFTVTFVLYEKDGLDRTKALRYWRDEHGPILATVPGVQRYVQQHAVGAPDGQPPFLGVASLGLADEQAFGVVAASPEAAGPLADLPHFAYPDRLSTAFVEDVVIVG